MQNKILIITPSFPPAYTGAGERANKLIKFFRKNYKDFDFIVLTQSHGGFVKDQMNDIEVVRIGSFSVSEKIPFSSYFNYILDYISRFFHAILILTREKNIKVIHCFGLYRLALAVLLMNTIFFRKDTIGEITLMSSDDPITFSSRSSIGYIGKAIKKNLLSKINLFVSLSKDITESFNKTAIDKSKIWERLNPVDSNIFNINLDSRRLMRRDLKIAENEKVFVTVGRICRRKNQLELINLFEGRSEENFKILIVGPTKNEDDLIYVKEINDRIKELNLYNKVELIIKKVKNVTDYLNASDYFLFSSFSEGCPNSVLEALSSGLPVFGINHCNSLSELILNPEMGIVVEPELGMEKKKIKFSDFLLKDYNADYIHSTIQSVASNEFVYSEYQKIYWSLIK